MHRFAFCMTLILTLFTPRGDAAAQSMQCAPRAQLLDQLGKVGQQRRALGLAGQAVMELYTANRSSRWTITVTMPDGKMCLLAHGNSFEALDEIFPAQGVRS